MADKCTPPLNFVSNGSAGSAFPPPLDPSDVPLTTQQPTFSQVACEALASECNQPDPISAIDDLPALADTVDALATASDSQLGAILEELDSVVGTQDQEQAFGDFAGAQPGAQGFVDGFNGISVPAIPSVPLVTPAGNVAVAPGATPEQGGVVATGAQPYILHLQIAFGVGHLDTLQVEGLDGPNPPIVGVAGFDVEPDAQGTQRIFALININPAQPGTFNGTLHVSALVTITGITARVTNNVPFTVVVQ